MLTLPIKKKWFDLILSGEKREEYRKLSPYYTSRFQNLFHGDTDEKEICFRNGYSSTSPSVVAVCTVDIGEGREEWGAEPGKVYYRLHIKRIQMLTAK